MKIAYKFTQHELALLAGKEVMRVLGKSGDFSFNAHWTTRPDSIEDSISVEIEITDAPKAAPP